MTALTTKQKLFIEAYLANPNGTEAARKAGYTGSVGTLKSIASQNLAKPAIAAALKKRVDKAIITADEVLHGIREIALKGERDADRLRAYELLGKHLTLFTDHVKHSGETATRVIVEYATDDDGD